MSKTGILFLILTIVICFGGFILSIFLSMKTNIEGRGEAETKNR